MNLIELSRCWQYAKAKCDSLKSEIIDNVFVDAYYGDSSRVYGIRFCIRFCGIADSYYTGTCETENELKDSIDRQINRIKKEFCD